MKWSGRYKGYHAGLLRKDLTSGFIVGIVAIPLGMAFAIASGVKPEYGLYTTIVAGILISLMGGSKFQIGGPTGAFIPILLAIVMQYGYENLLIAGLLAGVILLLMGLFRLGALIKYIPRPVTIGFTAGIAVTIFSGQISSFLGLEGVQRHEYFWDNMREIVLRLPTISVYSIITACICLAVLIVVPKLAPKVPASLVGIVASTLIAAWLFPGKIATIGSAYGAIPRGLPQFHMMNLTWDQVTMMIQPAIIIAVLGSIESLLSAVVADGMTGTRHNSNRELIGQGVANIVTPFFGGIPATGAIARTATNIKNGAVSPLSGIIHGVVVLFIVALFAPYASSIPLASMAPILMLVAWNMSERKVFAHMVKMRTTDTVVLLITFLLTVFTTLTIAVEAGLALSVLLFIKRMSDLVTIKKVLPDHSTEKQKVAPHIVSEQHDCPQISIFTVEGPLFFGASQTFADFGAKVEQGSPPQAVIVRMGKVPFMDTTGEAGLIALANKLHNTRIPFIITGLRPQPRKLLLKTGGLAVIGKDHLFEHTGEALNYVFGLLDSRKCRGCQLFAFHECEGFSGMKRPEGQGAHRCQSSQLSPSSPLSQSSRTAMPSSEPTVTNL